jgi:aquaporin Z
METKTSLKLFSEMAGTFTLVLFGCSAAVVSGVGHTALAGIGQVGIAMAFGFSVLVMVYAIGGISGCHINPAITVAMLVAGKIRPGAAVGYVVAQFAGAVLGAGVLYLIQKGLPGFSPGEWAYGSNGWGESYGAGYNSASAFLAEAIFTFLFLFVIFGVTSRWGNSTMAGLAIGLTLVLIHLVAIPITGTSVNPARSFGPALFAGGKAWGQLWLFIVAPVVGAIAAALVWKILESSGDGR